MVARNGNDLNLRPRLVFNYAEVHSSVDSVTEERTEGNAMSIAQLVVEDAQNSIRPVQSYLGSHEHLLEQIGVNRLIEPGAETPLVDMAQAVERVGSGPSLPPLASIQVVQPVNTHSQAYEDQVQREVNRRLQQQQKQQPMVHRHIDANKVFQSLSSKTNNQSIMQYLKIFALHHQDYQLSDAQLKAQLYKKIGDAERTHLELIDFQLDSYTFEDIVNSLVEEFEGSMRVDEAVRKFTLFVPQEGESLNELKTRMKKCLMYLLTVGGKEYALPTFLVTDKIRSFLPNVYQNYMAQIELSRYVGLDAVGVIDLVFAHLSLYDLNRSFRFRQNTNRFNPRGRGGRGYYNFRGRESRGMMNRQTRQSGGSQRRTGITDRGELKCWICSGPHYASRCDNNRSHGNFGNQGSNNNPRDNRINDHTDRINCISAMGHLNCVSGNKDVVNAVDGEEVDLSIHILIRVNDCGLSALVDSGATCNIISMNLAEQFGTTITKVHKKARLPDNKVITTHGIIDLPIQLATDQAASIVRFWVFSSQYICEDTVILGEPFIKLCDYVYVKPKRLG